MGPRLKESKPICHSAGGVTALLLSLLSYDTVGGGLGCATSLFVAGIREIDDILDGSVHLYKVWFL